MGLRGSSHTVRPVVFCCLLQPGTACHSLWGEEGEACQEALTCPQGVQVSSSLAEYAS